MLTPGHNFLVVENNELLVNYKKVFRGVWQKLQTLMWRRGIHKCLVEDFVKWKFFSSPSQAHFGKNCERKMGGGRK